MKTLTLEHLAPYLEHKLQTNYGELIGIRNWVGWCGTFKAKYGENNIPISAIKPHLRSLSDLTKEIEHNGEKFVPILKILEFLKIKHISYNLLDNSVDLVLDPTKHRANTKTKENIKVRFWFNNFQGVGFYCSNMNLFMYKDIYGALQKLFEWHFDTQNLIESGLAIDINTLEK